MPDKSILSINLRRVRDSRGLTQEEAAQKLGLNRSTYAAYEEDRAKPAPLTLVNICREFNIENIAAFITEPDFSPNLANDVSKRA